MTGAAQEQEQEPLCDCGDELPWAGLPSCFYCMDPVIAVALAKYYHGLALDVMRGVDRAKVVVANDAAADAADATVKAFQGELPALEAAVAEAVAAERKAQDRLRGAAEHSRKCAAAEKRAQWEQGSPERQTAALVKARAAADVAERAKAALEGATAVRVAAEGAVAAHHEKAAALEDAAVQAMRRADNPPEQVEMSVWTAFTAHPLLVLAQDGLTDTEKGSVLAQVLAAAKMCGLEDGLLAQGRKEGREAAEAEARNRPVLVSADGTPGSTRLVPQIGTWPGRRG